MDLPDDIFVLVLEKALPQSIIPSNCSEPIVIETPICMASKKSAIGLYHKWNGLGHGAIKIGRVIFSDIDQIRPIDTIVDLIKHDNDLLDKLIDNIAPLFDGIDTKVMADNDRALLQIKILEWVREL